MKPSEPPSGFPRAALPLGALAVAFASGALFGVEIRLVGAFGAHAGHRVRLGDVQSLSVIAAHARRER
jgi:hypothetical protein